MRATIKTEINHISNGEWKTQATVTLGDEIYLTLMVTITPYKIQVHIPQSYYPLPENIRTEFTWEEEPFYSLQGQYLQIAHLLATDVCWKLRVANLARPDPEPAA